MSFTLPLTSLSSIPRCSYITLIIHLLHCYSVLSDRIEAVNEPRVVPGADTPSHGTQHRACYWPPNTDTLFILDSTLNVGTVENHRQLLEFVTRLARQILASPDQGTSIALVQFTPEAKFEFDFQLEEERLHQWDRMERRIKTIPYMPCSSPRQEYCSRRAASLNSIVEWMLNTRESSNRPQAIDVLVLVTTALYRPPELNVGEVLVKPQRTPIHIFVVTVGTTSTEPTGKPYQFAATTAHLAVKDFSHLSEVVAPLCESVNSFIGEFWLLILIQYSQFRPTGHPQPFQTLP